MRKNGLFALLAFILVFTACKPAATATTTAVPAKTMECTIATSIFPQPKAESAKTYAPITSSDWTKGPENATMTIIEYSDFT